MTFRRLLAPSLAVLLACAPAAKVTGGPAPSRAVDLEGLDRSVAPGDDFFAFANGGWMKTTEIPPDRSTWGTGGILSELTAKRTADLIAETAKTAAPAGSDARKIGDYYASFMDEAGIEAKGLAPLQPTLDLVAAISDRKQLAHYLGGSVRADVDVLNATILYTDNIFGLWVAQDLDDPGRYSPFLLQGGLGMPDREYYLNPSAKMAELRGKYETHVAAMLRLAGVQGAEAKAPRLVELERRIAEVHSSVADTEDVLKGNNHWKREDFSAKAPGLDWPAFFAALGLDKEREFVAWQPKAVSGISALAASEPLETWKDYLVFHAIEHAAPFLPKAFVDERFAFYGKALQGTPQLRDRWKRAVSATDAALGEAVGKLYVER